MIAWRRHPGLRNVATCAALYLGALALYLVAAARTGLGADEMGRLHAVAQTGELLRRIGVEGLDEALTRAAVDPIFLTLRSTLGLPTLVGGYFAALLEERATFVPLILRERMGYLVIAASAIPLVFILVRRWLGFRAALAAALLLTLMQPLIHQVATTSPDAVAGAGWLAVGAAYVRSRGDRPILWGMTTGVLFGLALSISLSSTMLLALVVAHFAASGGAAWWRGARAGRATLPAALL